MLNRLLFKTVRHKLPSRIAGSLSDTWIITADSSVDRECRFNGEPFIQFMKAPEADTHPIFMPCPVGHVRENGLTCWRRENLTGHCTCDIPYFNIDDVPHHHTISVGKLQRWTIDDC